VLSEPSVTDSVKQTHSRSDRGCKAKKLWDVSLGVALSQLSCGCSLPGSDDGDGNGNGQELQ